MRRVRWYGPSILLLVTTFLVMVTGPRLARHIAWAQEDVKILRVKDSLARNGTLAELSQSFRQVVQAVEPSVVYIQVSSKRRGNGPGGALEEDLFKRFFGPDALPRDREDGGRDGEMDRYNVPQTYGSGSGWVYDNLGHIVTNNHVIDNADVITIRFQDGSEREATIVGTDPKTDIAVLKIEGGDLHPASLAQDQAEQGDIVFAFGSPFRFEFSVSQGIVSAKGRRLGILDNKQGYEDFIQTDAAINPGNSGGPLTNIYGQVVGMNTAIATRSGGYQGLGFAIPIDMVVNIVEQLIATGKVSRGYLGIYIADLDPKLARTFGYEGEGVLVENPIDGGPAIKAGVQRGDIISHIDGHKVGSADELRNLVAGLPPGTTLDLEVFRAGEQLELEITIAELPEQVASAGTKRDPFEVRDEQGRELLRKLGIESATALTEEIAERLDIEFQPGVVIQSVRRGSVAAAGRLAPRQVITAVMGAPVDSVEQLVTELRKHDLSSGVRISVFERDVRRFVLLELPNE